MRYLLSLLYRFGLWMHNRLYDRGVCQEHTAPVTTICVGNLAVGGTGKTPHTEYLIRLLSEHYKTAYLSRGYKRQTNGFRLADENGNADNAFTIGDEAMQVHRKFENIPVAVDEDRLHGIEMLKNRIRDLQVVLLDDAMQHRNLRAGINILLTRADNLYVNDHTLPYGSLRDLISSAQRANIIIVTSCKAQLTPIEKRIIHKQLHPLPHQQLYFTTVRYLPPYPLFEDKATDLNTIDKNIALLTAIADAQPLLQHVRQQYPDVRLFSFPDHHMFTRKQLDQLKYRSIVFTTEKDAVKLLAMNDLSDALKAKIYVIPIEIQFLTQQEQQQFNNQISAYVKESNRNR